MTEKVNGMARSGEFISRDIEYFTAYTLIDITDSGVTRPYDANSDGYRQAQNLNAILQSIGLRTQPIIVSVSKNTSEPMTNYQFGTDFDSEFHTVWVLHFATDYKGAWTNNSDPVYFLDRNCDGVAIITGIEDTASITPAAFSTNDVAKKNLYFEQRDLL